MVRGGPLRASFASSSTTSLALSTPGASPHSSDKPVATPTPSLGLHRAAGTGNVALVLYALENGQAPNGLLNGVAPLHVAACVGDVVATQLLIAFGADVNQPRARSRSNPAPGVEGSTPLHFAAANGHYAVVCVLLENGARPSPTDRDGQTPESLARANHHTTCADLVRQCAMTHGAQGHIERDSVREAGYAVQWGDEVVAPVSRENSPEIMRPPRERTALAPPVLPSYWTKPVAVPLHIRTDVTETPQRSSTASPAPSEVRWRASLPLFLEKATHPASSLRALWPQGNAAPAIHHSRAADDADDHASTSGLRVPRISSRTGLSNLLKRATGTASYPRTPDDSVSAVARDDSDPSRFSGILSPTALLSLVNRRSQENLSTASSAERSESPGPSASPASDTASARAALRGRDAGASRSDAARLRSRRAEPLALAVPSGVPRTTRTARLRSSSVSAAHPTQAWDGERTAAPRAPTTRARASSEVQPPAEGAASSGALVWSAPVPAPGSARSTPPGGEVVRSILDQGTVLGAAHDAHGHSSLAALLAQYGASLEHGSGSSEDVPM
ncbi:hypothetical protein CBS9595_001759 [Malassezia furfur]|nr:hypothetical protein CBS9595_001759 [Malassezia furfur]